MNHIEELFKRKSNNILSVYFTAGYPTIDSTVAIIKTLSESGADMIEIGMPFSDPVADGPVIQKSSDIALKNGMSLKLLFGLLADIRKITDIPLLLMGYFNPVLQFGIENFLIKCKETGIDGVILPDLPPDIYIKEYSALFHKYNICNILLITPQTTEERIHIIDSISNGFIYMVSSSSTTGIKMNGFTDEQFNYFRRVREMKLKNPLLVGFGISGHESFEQVCKYSNGAIIGSAFVKMTGESPSFLKEIKLFIENIAGK